MPNKLISQLPVASTPTGEELLVLEQEQVTKQITTNDLLEALWDAHGGIVSCTLQSETAQTAHSESAVSYDRTYRITYADGTYTDITIPDGVGIKRVGYSESSSGITHNLRFYLTDGRAYPTDGTITWRDGRGVASVVETQSGRTHTYTVTYNYNLSGQSNQTFQVEDGVSVSNITSSQPSGSLTNTITVTLDDGTTKTFTVDDGVGISTITASGQTMTINLTDGTSRTVTLPMMSVYVRYADDASGTNFGTTPRDWMGVLTTTDSSQSLYPANYTWYEIKGETGDNAEVSTYQRQYKYTDDGTQYPTSGYYSTIAAAQSAVGGAIQGKYLWIATTITWNNGTPSVIYSCSYQGLDGSGLTGVVKSLYMSDTDTSLAPDANGQVSVSSADMGAIKAPATASDGQVLTWDATNQAWYAGSVATGAVNSVNSQLPDVSGNVALKGTDIPMSSTDSTTVKAAIDSKANTSALSSYLPLSGGTMTGGSDFGTATTPVSRTVLMQGYVVGGSSATARTYKDLIQLVNADGNRVAVVRAIDDVGYNELDIMVLGENNSPTNALQLINTNGVQTARIYGALTIPSPSAGDSSTLAATTAWAQNEFKYKSGNTVNIGGGVFAGYFDSSKNLYFHIPLNKDLANISSASISTDTSWAIFCAGSVLLSNTTLASFGTITCTKNETGVLVKVVPSSTSSITARETVSVRANTATLTLS